MSVRYLKQLFKPASVAVLGASNTADSVGGIVMRNLLQGGFTGPILPVNRKYQAVQGVLAYPSVAALPLVPDMAVIAVPPDDTLTALKELADRGTRAAIVVASGIGWAGVKPDVAAAIRDTARSHGIRVLGPNSLGVLAPGIGLNASFAPQPANKGRIAFVSQSGAVCTSVLDWARPKGIGFSHFISMGDMLNTDFGDVLDYLGSDPDTRAILLYIESIPLRRNFMSAARAAARNKPVLAIKAGRRNASQQATISHTGILAGADLVYDAAFRRSGMLRVYTIEELFAATETLSVMTKPKGERMAILTNGGGFGVMGVDELDEQGGLLAELTPETIEALNSVLPATWSRGNPVDIMGEASPERYAAALKILSAAKEVDTVVVMHSPVATTDPLAITEALIPVIKQSRRVSISTCWIGDELVRDSRRRFHEAAIPTFTTPYQAIRSFLHTVAYRKNQDMLMETPASLPTEFTPNITIARRLISDALSAGRTTLSEPEAKALLSAYGIAVVETRVAHTPAEARAVADAMGYPVVLKILSDDISHKSEHGGVRLDLTSGDEVEKAAQSMLTRLSISFPEARISGFTVQPMHRHSLGQELIVGINTDPIFGPVILFGQGGTAAEIIADRAVTLPPLNMALAAEVIGRTRIGKVLQGAKAHSAADLESLSLALIQVAQMTVDLPEIRELDINPLLASPDGVIALDARVVLALYAGTNPTDRLAIRPYPQDLEETFVMKGGRPVLLRPIRPEDEPNHHVFVSRLTPEDIRFRFFGLVQELPHSQMARMTQIDYDREMAFIATAPDSDGREETLGVVRAVTDPDNETTEFSIVVRSDLKGAGLAKAMMVKMIRYCQSRKTRTMVGQVLKENARMLTFVEHLGFRRVRMVEIDVVEVELDLQSARTEGVPLFD